MKHKKKKAIKEKKLDIIDSDSDEERPKSLIDSDEDQMEMMNNAMGKGSWIFKNPKKEE